MTVGAVDRSQKCLYKNTKVFFRNGSKSIQHQGHSPVFELEKYRQRIKVANNGDHKTPVLVEHVTKCSETIGILLATPFDRHS